MKGHINPHHKVSKNLQVQHLRVRGALQTSRRWLRLTTHTEGLYWRLEFKYLFRALKR